MSIRFTKVVRLIMEHISKYGFITNKQCEKIFYKDSRQPYVQAQVKMKLLFDSGVVKREFNTFTNEYIYSYDGKLPSYHRLYMMNLYAHLYSKYEVLYFKTENEWMNGKRRNDGHVIFKRDDGTTIGLLVEIDINHATNQNKLDSIYNSLDVQQWYSENYGVDYYPSILIINATGRTNIKSDEYTVICCDFDFNNLIELL